MALCLFALLLGTAAGYIGHNHTVSIAQLVFPKEPKKLFHTNQFTVLMLGCDEDRTPGGKIIENNKARSDMMLIAQIDFDKNLITGLSIPRDTAVSLDGGPEHKINAYHAYGGAEMSKRAVEALLPGVGIDRVVTINFEGFDDMVNALGGVPVDVEKNMDYDDDAGHLHIHLKKGRHLLNGQQAEGYVRFRHSDSDYARADRQHNFMLAFKAAAQQKPVAFPYLMDGLTKMLKDGMSSDEVVSLGTFVRELPKDRLKFGSLPVHDRPHSRSFMVDVNEDELPKVLKEYNLLENNNPAVNR
ncbi:MAG TPA: LCP family protein [Fimbriimonadaceae bacterium]|nr:LCP family protein [Fimbriimonadaceae bacterium]